jgi:hypothetical protein
MTTEAEADRIVARYGMPMKWITMGIEKSLPESWDEKKRHELARVFAARLTMFLLKAEHMRGFEDMDAEFLCHRLDNCLPAVCNAFGLTGRRDGDYRKGII